jgi:hypothetical protein
MFKCKLVSLLLMATFMAFAATAWSDEHESEDVDLNRVDINTISCKDVMILGTPNRDETITFIHGYLAGEAKQTVLDAEVLGAATDKFIDTCLDNPGKKAFSVMRAIVTG